MPDLTRQDYKRAIRDQPDLRGLYKWARERDAKGLNKLLSYLSDAVLLQWDYNTLFRLLRGHDLYKKYSKWMSDRGVAEEEDPSPTPPDEDVEDVVDEPDFDPVEAQRMEDVRDAILEYLKDWGLEGLEAWVENAIQQKWSEARILMELRKHPIYLAAFPENQLRADAGFSWMPESEILAYRDAARRMAKDYLGLDVSNMEISKLIGKDVSLAEWERRLETWRNVERWGPAVKQVFQMELGYDISDERVWAFMSPDIPTPDLDVAYERALMRGQPAVLGLSIRPEEEATMLQEFGISAEEAFKGYQGIVQEMPRFEKLRYIEAYLTGRPEDFPLGPQSLEGANFSTLFKALQLGDPDALAELRAIQAREVARYQAKGGPGRRLTGKSGLLGRYET